MNTIAKMMHTMPTAMYPQPRKRFFPPSQFVVVITSDFSVAFDTKKSTLPLALFPYLQGCPP